MFLVCLIAYKEHVAVNNMHIHKLNLYPFIFKDANDYTPLNLVDILLNFNNDNRRMCFNITINDDSVYEFEEQFSVELRTFTQLPNLEVIPDVANITIIDTTGT